MILAISGLGLFVLLGMIAPAVVFCFASKGSHTNQDKLGAAVVIFIAFWFLFGLVYIVVTK